jgi:hypothetical protein
MSQITIYDTSSIMGDVSQFTPNEGTSPVVPTAGGNVDLIGDNGINTVGGTNQVTFELDPDVVSFLAGQTVGATTDDLFTYTLSANEAISISTILIAADESDYADNIGGGANVVAYRTGGGAVLQTKVIAVTKNPGTPAGVNVDWVVSGNDVILRVTGAAGTTYNWRGKANYTTV